MKEDALRYHSRGRPGKIEVTLTKPCLTQRDLSLAYTPGVAEPCLEIQAHPDRVYDYTIKGNLVAVVSNGTAVLGLGSIGPAAGKPVMEGKAVLFKRFADIDVFDLEIDERDPQKLVDIIASLEPTFGGINLEDIKAPECFEIEAALRERMQIPVFHDDQHGTAIISAAALLNAAEIQEKDLSQVRVAVSGAGASAISCMNLWQKLGVQATNIVMCDSKGVLHEGRRGQVDPSKEPYLRNTDARTLADAVRGADVFIGLSTGDVLSAEMAKAMAPRPILLPLANPNPEISYPVAREARPDAVIGTGRSDYPNQVNNVLGFPFIFRGALDVGARCINDEMKLAAAKALADLARTEVPDTVVAAYGGTPLKFGADYFLPKPLDERVLLWVAPAVAKAAMETGVARLKVDLGSYRDELERRLGPSRSLMRQVIQRVSISPKRIILADANDDRVLRAVRVILEDRIAIPILIGDAPRIAARAAELGVDVAEAEIVSTTKRPGLERDVRGLLEIRGRRGMTEPDARKSLRQSPTMTGLMMVHAGDADGLIAGVRHSYPETIRSALKLVGLDTGILAPAGVHILVTQSGPLFFADTTVNISPDARMLAGIAQMVARFARDMGVEPHVAMLSYANFGASAHADSRKVADAVALLREMEPGLDVEGEMQVEVAVDPAARKRNWPHTRFEGPANVFVFPNLSAAHTAYSLLSHFGQVDEIGPVLLGLKKPITALPASCSVDTIVRLTAITALHATSRLPAATSEAVAIAEVL